MNLAERKELLKNLALKEKSNGSMIFQLIESGCLDLVIGKLTESKTKTNTKCLPMTKKGYLTWDEQFIDVISEFIYYFERSFAPTIHKFAYLKILLENKAPEFLLCKNYWGDNTFIPYYQYHIRKFLVENLYDNIRFLYKDFENQRFFKGLDITDKLSLKNAKSVDILFAFMREIIWCNYDEYSLFYVFSNYKNEVKSLAEEHVNKSIVFSREQVWNDYDDHWSRLIYKYNQHIHSVQNLIGINYPDNS
ncbi:MAG: hypothetical protein Q4G05_01745 [Clostridia bacterium]|nr:hypothetical protein [Clostridia bacterium]